MMYLAGCCESERRAAGTLPERRLPQTLNAVRLPGGDALAGKAPSCEGMAPLSRLLLISKVTRAARDDSDCGMAPESWLRLRRRVVRLARLPRLGIPPERLF